MSKYMGSANFCSALYIWNYFMSKNNPGYPKLVTKYCEFIYLYKIMMCCNCVYKFYYFLFMITWWTSGVYISKILGKYFRRPCSISNAIRILVKKFKRTGCMQDENVRRPRTRTWNEGIRYVRQVFEKDQELLVRNTSGFWM